MNPEKKSRFSIVPENADRDSGAEELRQNRISSIDAEGKSFPGIGSVLQHKKTLLVSAGLLAVVVAGIFLVTKFVNRPSSFLGQEGERVHYDDEKRLIPETASENIHLRRGKESYYKGYLNDAAAEFKEVVESAAPDSDKAVALTFLGIMADEKGKTDEAIDYYNRAIRFNGRDPLIYRNLSIAQRHRKDYPAAQDAIERAISLDPQNTKNRVLYGNILFEQKKYGDAKRIYQDALSRDPENASALYNMGVSLLRGGDRVSAMEYFKKAGDADKLGKVAHMSYSKLGSMFSTMQDNDMAEKYLKMAIAVDPTDPVDRYNLGLVHLKRNDKERALGEFLKAQELAKNDAKVLEGLGEAYFSLKEYDKSLDVYNKLGAVNNRDARVLSRIAEIYYEKGELDSAYDHYKKITAMEPASENARIAYINMGNIMDDAQRYEEAIDSYKKALTISPKDDAALYNLGIAYKHAGRPELAIEVWKKSSELNPDSPRPLMAIADYYYEKKHYDLAMDEYQRVLRRWPNVQDAHFNLGAVYYKKNLVDFAIGEYKKVLEINEGNDLARKSYVNLAILTSKKVPGEKGLEESMNYAQKALLMKPGDPEALHSLGVIYYRKEMADKAIDTFYQVVRASRDPARVADAYNYIGMSYYRNGNFRKALQAFNRGVEEDPSNEEIRVNRQTASQAYERHLEDR